jgi:hypothetical protein
LHVHQVEGGHRFENVIKPLLVRLEQEELSPEPFRRHGVASVFICKDIKKMEVELGDLWLEDIWPRLLGQGSLHDEIGGMEVWTIRGCSEFILLDYSNWRLSSVCFEVSKWQKHSLAKVTRPVEADVGSPGLTGD